MNKKTIYLFRHGLTDWNQQRRMQGHTDIPLNLEGIYQAQALRPFFKSNPIDLVFCSPLSRAIHTAQLATGENKPIQIKELIEIHLGVAEGIQEKELIQKFGEDVLNRWRSFHPDDKDISYPNAEKKGNATERLHSGLMQIIKNYTFTSAAICSHGFIMRRYFHQLKEQEMGTSFIPTTVEEFPLVPNCQIYTLESDGEKILWKSGPIKP